MIEFVTPAGLSRLLNMGEEYIKNSIRNGIIKPDALTRNPHRVFFLKCRAADLKYLLTSRCVICGAEFKKTTTQNTCSGRCKELQEEIKHCEWQAKNLVRHRKQQSEWAEREKAKNPRRWLKRAAERSRKSSAKARRLLTDRYVAANFFKGIPRQIVPSKLIELKRKHITLIRLCRQKI